MHGNKLTPNIRSLSACVFLYAGKIHTVYYIRITWVPDANDIECASGRRNTWTRCFAHVRLPRV